MLSLIARYARSAGDTDAAGSRVTAQQICLGGNEFPRPLLHFKMLSGGGGGGLIFDFMGQMSPKRSVLSNTNGNCD